MAITQFDVELTTKGLGPNLPQRAGRALWAPMLAMALMAFPVGAILGIIRANAVDTGGSASTIAALSHFIPAVNFLGFAAVFAAISFAIARILGEFRVGGGEVQEAAGTRVQTLRMPNTGKAFILTMAMGMMVLLAGVILHVVAGVAIANESASALANAESWAVWLEAVRRIGVSIYLVSFLLGLSTIIYVLRFQAVRIQELPGEAS